MKSLKTMKANPHLALLAALALGQGAIGCAFAQSAEKVPADTKQPQPTASGMTVAIDPVTKQIRPMTAEDAAALQAAKSTQPAPKLSSQKLVPTRYPNGRLSLRLPESFMESTVATKSPDGKLTFHCVSNHDLGENGLLAADAKPTVSAQPAPSPTPIPARTVRFEEK